MRTLYSGDDCDNIAKILGLAYIIHSSYFMTTFELQLHDTIRIGMMCSYLVLLLVIVAETRTSLRCIDDMRVFSENVLPMGQLKEAL